MASAAIRPRARTSITSGLYITFDGTSVAVTTDGSGTPALTISTPGWYTFQNTYTKGATPTSLVEKDMNIFDAAETLLSSTLVLGNSDGGTLESANLAGPGYIWLPVWQDGFSNDLLRIDNVRADATPAPEPGSMVLLTSGLVLAVGAGACRRATEARPCQQSGEQQDE